MLYAHFLYSYVYMYIVQFSQITSFYPVKRDLQPFSAGVLNLRSVDQSLPLGHPPLFSLIFCVPQYRWPLAKRKLPLTHWQIAIARDTYGQREEIRSGPPTQCWKNKRRHGQE
jgi:hypothetical protein